MAFDPRTLPAKVYEEFNKGPIWWPSVVKKGVEAGIKDADRLASIVFYLHHPERNGRAIDPSETALIAQWKGFRTLIKPMVPEMAKPKRADPSEPDDSLWTCDEVEAEKIRSAWGQDILDWAMQPPHGPEAKEFLPPPALRGNYKTVFVWKSPDPARHCVANPKQRLQILAMLRDDKAYWDVRTNHSRVGSPALQSAAETAIRDYREYIIVRKMCPRAAYNRLLQVNKDMVYQMFLGFYQMLSPVGGVAGAHPGSDVVAGILKWIVTGQPCAKPLANGDRV